MPCSLNTKERLCQTLMCELAFNNEKDTRINNQLQMVIICL